MLFIYNVTLTTQLASPPIPILFPLRLLRLERRFMRPDDNILDIQS